MNRSYGYIESGTSPFDINADEHIFYNGNLPEYYELKVLPSIVNQGNENCCVSCALNSLLYSFNKLNCSTIEKLKFNWIYNERSDKNIEGMTPREGFEILKNHGYINHYARVNDLDSIKKSIIAKGQVLIGLPVKSNEDYFWKGSENYGGHAVSLVGYDKDSFILRNSWGVEYGNYGYIHFPFDDFKYILECWVILD